jgi:Tol biopolymer transport system component
MVKYHWMIVSLVMIIVWLGGCSKTVTPLPTQRILPTTPVSATQTPVKSPASIKTNTPPRPASTTPAAAKPTPTYTQPVTPTRTRRTTRTASPVPTRASIHGDSFSPALSADGRYVAFVSRASDLIQAKDSRCWTEYEANYPCTDIFVFDRQEGAMRLISAAPDGKPSNGSSWSPALSADGRWVVFMSDAANLSPGKITNDLGIYLYDMESRNLELIAASARDPSISADGRFVVYNAIEVPNIYVYERETKKSKGIIKTLDGQSHNGDIWSPQISGDGRWIAFWSWAGNLTPDDTEQCREGEVTNFSCGDVFLYDRDTDVMMRIAMNEGYGLGMGTFPISVSGDGNRLSFSGRVYDREQKNYVCEYCSGVLSADGKLVAYEGYPGFYVRDLTTGVEQRVDVASDGIPGNGEWVGFQNLVEGPDFEPGVAISGDGRFVAFSSTASNLTADEKQSCSDALFAPHACYDIYVHDRETGVTELVSKPIE